MLELPQIFIDLFPSNYIDAEIWYALDVHIHFIIRPLGLAEDNLLKHKS